MTTFICDWSNHNTGVLSQAQARDLVAFIHKITDGDHWFEDPYFKQHVDMARGLGIPVLGGYHVLWGNRDLKSQAQWYVDRVRALAPDAAKFGVWMSDNEPFGYNGKPTIDQVNTFNGYVAQIAGVPASAVEAYCPGWTYGSAVQGLKYPWWQSNYGTNPSGRYQDVYPGDSSSRWSSYTAMSLLQYGSNTDIGDASAFRGSKQDFINFLGGNMTSPSADNQWTFTETGQRPNKPDTMTYPEPAEPLPTTGYMSSQVWPSPNNYAGGVNARIMQDAYRTRLWAQQILQKLATLEAPTVDPEDLKEAVKEALMDPEVIAELVSAFQSVHFTGTFRTD